MIGLVVLKEFSRNGNDSINIFVRNPSVHEGMKRDDINNQVDKGGFPSLRDTVFFPSLYFC